MIIAEEIARRIYAKLVCEMFMKAGIVWLSVHFILLSNPVQNVPWTTELYDTILTGQTI